MKTKVIEKTLFMSVFAMLGLLSLRQQFGIIEPPIQKFDGEQRHDPDCLDRRRETQH